MVCPRRSLLLSADFSVPVEESWVHPFWVSEVGRGLKKTHSILLPPTPQSGSALCRLLRADWHQWDFIVLKGRLCVPPTDFMLRSACPPIAGTGRRVPLYEGRAPSWAPEVAVRVV